MGRRRNSASSNPLGCFFLLVLGLIIYAVQKIGAFLNSIPTPLLVILLVGIVAFTAFLIYKKRHPNNVQNENDDFGNNPISPGLSDSTSCFGEVENTITDPIEQIPAFGNESEQENVNTTLKKYLKKFWLQLILYRPYIRNFVIDMILLRLFGIIRLNRLKMNR